ncbi:JADE1 protein, partial [Certhia brachydactyla]|nr:JADE1 protein [Certhia familiaris]NXP00697.1 JADE1 protein [Certhia brachydactyla]
GMLELDEYTMERVMEEFEQRCCDNMNHAIETEEGLGIEYDEDVVCDVCQSPDGEDGNEMVFCDKCNICVHQACYGILKVPEGSWLCRTCALGVQPKCLLCPKKGGAMKPTRSGTKWVHVSCALWIPEV